MPGCGGAVHGKRLSLISLNIFFSSFLSDSYPKVMTELGDQIVASIYQLSAFSNMVIPANRWAAPT